MYIGWYKLSWLYEYHQLLFITIVYGLFYTVKAYKNIFWEGLLGGRVYFKRFSQINRRYLPSKRY